LCSNAEEKVIVKVGLVRVSGPQIIRDRYAKTPAKMLRKMKGESRTVGKGHQGEEN